MENRWVRATNGEKVYALNLSGVAYMQRTGESTQVHYGNGLTVTVAETPEQLVDLADEEIYE